MGSDESLLAVEIWAAQTDPAPLRHAMESICAGSFRSAQGRAPQVPHFRSAEAGPALVGAVVGVSASLLAEMLKGLFGLLKERRAQRIVIRDAETTLELPAEWLSHADSTQILSLFEQIKRMSRPKIML